MNLRLATFLLILSYTGLKSQNVYEISISSFAKGRSVEKVKFNLSRDGNKLVEQESHNGGFQFVIMEGDGTYRLEANKEGYIPKIIHFNSAEYPYINEYEIQEIDIEFHQSKSPGDEAEVGELKWSSLGNQFNVVKVDSSMIYVQNNYAKSEKSLAMIYAQSIEKGDELLTLQQPEYAINHYYIALLAKPNDDYAKKKINEIKQMMLTSKEKEKTADKDLLDKINRGEITQADVSTEEGVIYSVQLGAFSGEVKESKFSNVPDFKKIPYDDFTRVFSGEFTDLNEAISRKEQVKKLGYKDAWIVLMKDNQRIGF